MIFNRHRIVILGISVVFGLMLLRMLSLTYFDREFLQERGSTIAERTISIPVNRGIIYDRNRQPLAISIPTYSIWTDPGFDLIDPKDIPNLATALQISQRSLESTLRAAQDTRFVYLKRRTTQEIADAVEQLQIKGVRFKTEYRRYYPAAEVTSHVVGFTNIDGDGIEGLEAAKNQALRGRPGKRRVLRDREGRELRDLELSEPPVFGQDITLTLDLGLQYLTYRTLREAVFQYDAVSASAVVLSVASGEILAMANFPTFNPNDLTDRDPFRMRNRAIKDAYEPGSTIKPFSALAALESQHFRASSVINTSPGHLYVDQKLVEDPRDYGTLTLEKVLVKSSQVGIAKVALTLDENEISDVLLRAGFAKRPHSGLPHEAAGSLRLEELKRDIGRVTLAFGYGLSVSPLQLASAYLILASGGQKTPVTILRDQGLPQKPRKQIFFPADVQEILNILQGVVSPIGTAPSASVEGFAVAGKTGTVRKITNGQYDDTRHIAWFAGIVPVDEPQIVAVIVVNEPNGEVFSGGRVAAPIFSRIVKHALQLVVPHTEEGWNGDTS